MNPDESACYSRADLRFLREVCGALSQAAQASYTFHCLAGILAQAFGQASVVVRDIREGGGGGWTEHFVARYPSHAFQTLDAMTAGSLEGREKGQSSRDMAWDGSRFEERIVVAKDRVMVYRQVTNGERLMVTAVFGGNTLTGKRQALFVESCVHLAGELRRQRDWEVRPWQPQISPSSSFTACESNVVHTLLNYPQMSEKIAATQLGLSMHTVHTHLRMAYRKANVRSRGELMALIHIQRQEARALTLRELAAG
jgi:DNA-binding CsgD family transcriptional regulator